MPVFNERLELCQLPLPEQAYEESLDRSWLAFWLAEVSERFLSKAKKNTDGDKLHILMREDGQFEDIVCRVYNSPVGWDGGSLVENGNGAVIGSLMTHNWVVSTTKCIPWLGSRSHLPPLGTIRASFNLASRRYSLLAFPRASLTRGRRILVGKQRIRRKGLF